MAAKKTDKDEGKGKEAPAEERAGFEAAGERPELPRELPPEPLPALEDPYFPGESNLYARSPLRDVCGTRINREAAAWYRDHERLTSQTCAVRTAIDPNLEAWIADVGSFDPRAEVVQPPAAEWPLTRVVPRVSVAGRKMAFPLDPMTYLIDYGELHSNPHTLPDPEHYKRLCPNHLPEGSQAILTMMSRRALQLGLWVQPDFWQHPFLDQFAAIQIPDFSVFIDDPKPQLLLGERMRQIFAEEGAAAGRTVIPTILWSREEQLGRQVEMWLAAYPNVHTIGFDAAAGSPDVDRTAWAWRHLFAIEKYLKGADHIRWLFSGLTNGWQIRELNRIFPKGNYAVILPMSRYIAARRGSSDPQIHRANFLRTISQIQDFLTGRVVADPRPRPKAWPKTGRAVSD